MGMFPKKEFNSVLNAAETTGRVKLANQVARWAVSWKDDIPQEALDALISIIEEANNG
jgi:hypothetical protein